MIREARKAGLFRQSPQAFDMAFVDKTVGRAADKTINQIRDKRRVLVACHPKPFETHWQRTSIVAEEGKKGPTDYETVDVRKGGTHEADVLTIYPGNTEATWVAAHEHMYDAVYLPDCHGDWNGLMAERDIHEPTYKEDLFVMVNRLARLLKPGGALYLGKWMTDVDTEAARLMSMGFNVRVKHLIDPFLAGRVIEYVMVDAAQ